MMRREVRYFSPADQSESRRTVGGVKFHTCDGQPIGASLYSYRTREKIVSKLCRNGRYLDVGMYLCIPEMPRLSPHSHVYSLHSNIFSSQPTPHSMTLSI